jgi:hypothetical protein
MAGHRPESAWSCGIVDNCKASQSPSVLHGHTWEALIYCSSERENWKASQQQNRGWEDRLMLNCCAESRLMLYCKRERALALNCWIDSPLISNS